MPYTVNLIASFIDTILLIILGSTIFKIAWRKYFFPFSLIAIYTTFLIAVIKGNVHPILYLLILVATISIFVGFVTRTHLIITSTAVIVGLLTVLLTEVVVLLMFGLSGNEGIEVFMYGSVLQWTMLIGLIILLDYFDINIPFAEKWYQAVNMKLSFYTMWISSLFFILVLTFVVFYHQGFTLKDGGGLLLAGGFIISIVLGIYLVRHHYLEELELVEDTINKQYDFGFSRYVDIVRMQKHDTVDHLLKVRMLLEVGQIQSTKDYIDQAIDETSQAGKFGETYSDVITDILFLYQEEARQKDIRIDYKVLDDLKELPCELYETVAIFTNIISGAIEETMNLPLEERHIDLYIAREKDCISIQVINPYSVQFKRRREGVESPILPNTLSMESLSRIQSIIEKYNGKLSSNYIEDSHSTTIRIPC